VELRQSLHTTSAQTEAVAKEVRIDLEEVNSKRKIDKLSFEAELKAFRQRVGGAFEHSEALLRGLEHIAGVLSVSLQSERISAALDLQDFSDRKKDTLVSCRNDKRLTDVDMGFSQTGKEQKRSRGSSYQGIPLEVDLTALSKAEYAPGTVGYQNSIYDRQDIMVIREQLIHKAQEALQCGPQIPQPDMMHMDTKFDGQASQLSLLGRSDNGLSKGPKMSWDRPGSRGQPGARGNSPAGEINTPSVPRSSVLGINHGFGKAAPGSKVIRGGIQLPTLADQQPPMTVR